MVRGLIVVLLPDNRDLRAYDELRQYGLSNVFCSDTSSDSDESTEERVL